MYTETITLFNRYTSTQGDYWYPKVLENVDLIVDKAAINAKYGTDSSDTAKLHVKYKTVNGNVDINDYTYYPPKAWEDLTNDELATAITFRSGQSFDFFVLGAFQYTEPIDDSKYRNGFYDYMNKEYDNVFAISSASNPYKVIKHFEIMGK